MKTLQSAAPSPATRLDPGCQHGVETRGLWRGEPGKLLGTTSGHQQSKAGRRGSGAGGWSPFTETTLLFPFSSSVSKRTTPSFLPWAEAKPLPAPSSHPARLSPRPPWNPLSPDSQRVSAHIHHQLQGGVPVFSGLTPGAALIVHGALSPMDSLRRLLQLQPEHPQTSTDPTPSGFLPTGTRLRRSLWEWAPAGGETLQHKRSGSKFSGPAVGARA